MKKFICTLSIVVIFLFISSSVVGRTVPFTPCASLFNYYESQGWEIFGAATFKNDLSGEYNFEVEMSIPVTTDKGLTIRRITSEQQIKEGQDISYYVLFPFNHTFPVLTKIRFNGKTYCTGPPAHDEGKGVTPLSIEDVIVTKINTDVSSPSKPTAAPTAAPTTEKPKKEESNDEQCGVADDTTPLVLHGKPTRSGEYPWLVAMFYLGPSAEYKFRCAGTLITKTHVITAAHCVERTVVNKDDVVLVFGKHNIKTWAIRSTIRDVKTIYIHPAYRQPGDADIAILELYLPVEYTGTIKPACMWGTEKKDLVDVVGTNGIVVGWGRDEHSNEYIFEPRQLTMPIVSQETCLRSDERFIRITSNRSFCAGHRNGSIPCTGDSGGGFVIKHKGRFHLRGVVSVALVDSLTSTCDGSHYAVYTDVPQFSDWVTNILTRST